MVGKYLDVERLCCPDFRLRVLKIQQRCEFTPTFSILRPSCFCQDGERKISFNGRPLAPEVRTTRKVSTQSDVYSFGFIIYELLTSQFKLEGPISDKKMVKALAKHFSCSDKKIYDRLCEVVLSCWKEDPDERPTMREVKNALLAIRALEDPSGTGGTIHVQSGSISIRRNGVGGTTMRTRTILDNTQEALHEALHNENPVVLETSTGCVQAGTLEGLVIRAILGDGAFSHLLSLCRSVIFITL